MRNLKQIKPSFKGLQKVMILAFLQVVFGHLEAQNILISDGGTVPVSGGEMFYDAGGSAGNDGNTSHVITLVPANLGEAVCLDFTSFITHRSFGDADYLNIYDGLTVSDKAIGNLAGNYSAKYSNAFTPNRYGQDGSTVGGTDEFTPGVFCATNANGALTLEFDNNFSNLNPGWEAEVLTYVLANAGCNIQYNVDNLVCIDSIFSLNVLGVVGNSTFGNDFNSGAIGTGWSSTVGSATFTDVLACEPNGGYTTINTDNSIYVWMQNTSGARELVTSTLDVSNGGVLNFDFRFASDDAGSNGCESADNDEGVFVQYSVDNGASWSTIKLMFPCDAAVGGYKGTGEFVFDWTKIAVPLPIAAQTASTMFRWKQFTTTSGSEDSWGLDNVEITTFSNATLIINDLTNNVEIYNGAVLNVSEDIVQNTDVDYEIILDDGLGNSCTEYFTVAVESCGVSTCGDCSTPNCPVEFSTPSGSFTSCETLSSVTNETRVSYHTVTASADGTLGLIHSVNANYAGCSGLDADNMLTSRTATLYAVGDCGGTPIAIDVVNAGNSSTFNPEWYNLTPNGTYIVVFTIDIGNCVTNELCLDYYHPTPSCNTCANPSCTVSSVLADNVTDARLDLSTALTADGDQYGVNITNGETVTICVPVTVPVGTTVTGFKHNVQVGPGPCGDSTEQIITYTLSSTDCGTTYAPDRTNAQPVGSGFNPEWDNLAPGDYVLCYTINNDDFALCTDIDVYGLGYYNVVPVVPTCIFNAFTALDSTVTTDCGSLTYDFTLDVNFTDAPGSGTIQLLEGAVVLADDAFTGNTHTFSINGETVPGTSNTRNFTVQFSDETTCNLSIDFIEPLCTSCDFTIDSLITDVSCGATNDGSITITSTTNNSELDFTWTGPNGFTSTDSILTGLEAGVYDFVIDRNVPGTPGGVITDTLFLEGFEDGGAQWTITNNGENIFIVNDVYAGSTCNTNLGPFPVADVPDQPAIILNGPQSNYLHVMATTLCDPTITCPDPNFPPQNANFCSSASNPEVVLNNPISTVGYSNVTVSFYWLANATDVDDYGSIEYSIDNGSNWVIIEGNLSGSTNWTFNTNTIPALDNQPSILFRIKWTNDWGSSSDPAISIDQIVVTGETSGVGTPGCSYQLTGSIVVDQLICPCPADIGTVNVSIDGTDVTDASNEYFVCANSTIELQASGYTLPNGTAPIYAYAILTNYPTTADPYQDPAFLGDDEGDLSTTLNNATYQGNTFYVVPVTLDEVGDSPDQLDADGDACYAIGNVITIHFLNDYTVTATENCSNATVDVTISGAGPEFSNTLYTYLNVQPGNVNAGNPVDHSETTTLTGLLAGDQYSMTISDAYGCTYFFSGGPFVGINAGVVDLVTLTCADNDGSVAVEVVTGTPDYTLTLNGNNMGTESNGNFIINGLAAGNYTLNITDANNCGMDLPFTLNPPASPSLTVDPYDENCGQMDGEIDVIPAGGDGNYEFSLDGVNWQPVGFVNVAAGDYWVYVRDGNACLDSALATVNNVNVPVVDFDPSVYEGESPLDVVFTNISQNADQFVWNYGNGNTAVTVNGAQTFEEGTYTVTLIGTNAFGCMDSASVQIISYPAYEIVIPNVFTPNGDGENDLFYITSEGVNQMEVAVYNRWGNIIASFDGLIQGWNGQNQAGTPMESGVYFFVINLTTASGEEKSYDANVTLLR